MGMFGQRGKVDPVRRLIGLAAASGGNPERDALHFNFAPAHNDGMTAPLYRPQLRVLNGASRFPDAQAAR
jgi:hypothetical protein